MKSWILTLPNVGNSDVTVTNVQIWGDYIKDVWMYPASGGYASTTPVVLGNSMVSLSSDVDGSSQTYSAIIKYNAKTDHGDNGVNVEKKVYASALKLVTN